MLVGRGLSLAVCAALVVAFSATTMRADDTVDDVAQRDPYRDVRAEFLLALSAVDAGPAPTAPEDSAALRAYPLYPYLEAARIEHALASTSDAASGANVAARGFLDAHGDEPVARDVRRAWLESLARRAQWQTFLDELGSRSAGQALRCRSFRAQIALGDISGLAPDIISTWLTGSRLPSECEPAFQWLRAEGPLTDDLIAQRAILLLANDQASFARIIAGRLPQDRAAPLLKWADLIERPRHSVDALIAAPETELPPAALYAGWQRLSRNDPAAALARYEALIAAFDFDQEQASRYALALALGLAWDRRAQALAIFAKVDAAHLDDYALGWLARAALWAGDWPLAADSITAMSKKQRDDARWRYWAARAAEQLRDRSRARKLYRSILPTDNYYSAMAAARLDEPAAPHPRTLDVDRDHLRQIAAEPAFVRARELLYARLPQHAAAEWRYGYEGLNDTARDQSIHLAARWGWYDLSIATATRQSVFYDYSALYPRPYDDAVAAAAQLTKLEPPLIYGVIRQESLYRADAASHAGALGLTQLIPDTARRAARQWQQPVPQWADLFIPAVNVKLGAAELRSLIEEFGDQIPVGLAGYNAGPNAAERWLPEQPLASDIWIENIPYNETREYVQRVLWHSLVFAWLETGEPRSTQAWLAEITPVRHADLQAAE